MAYLQASKVHQQQLVPTSYEDLAIRSALQHQGSLEEQMAKYRWAGGPMYERHSCCKLLLSESTFYTGRGLPAVLTMPPRLWVL